MKPTETKWWEIQTLYFFTSGANLYFKKKKKSTGREWIVEHSPRILNARKEPPLLYRKFGWWELMQGDCTAQISKWICLKQNSTFRELGFKWSGPNVHSRQRQEGGRRGRKAEWMQANLFLVLLHVLIPQPLQFIDVLTHLLQYVKHSSQCLHA